MRIGLVAVGCLVVLLVGCASDVEPEAAPSVVTITATAPASAEAHSPTPTQTTPTEPPRLSREEAAARYLEIAGPRNAAVCPMSKFDYWTEQNRQDVQRIASSAADAARLFGEGLVAERWPLEMQPLIDQLVTEVTGDIDYYRGLSEARSVDEMGRMADDYAAAIAASNAGQQVRLQLGLPEARLEC